MALVAICIPIRDICGKFVENSWKCIMGDSQMARYTPISSYAAEPSHSVPKSRPCLTADQASHRGAAGSKVCKKRTKASLDRNRKSPNRSSPDLAKLRKHEVGMPPKAGLELKPGLTHRHTKYLMNPGKEHGPPEDRNDRTGREPHNQSPHSQQPFRKEDDPFKDFDAASGACSSSTLIDQQIWTEMDRSLEARLVSSGEDYEFIDREDFTDRNPVRPKRILHRGRREIIEYAPQPEPWPPVFPDMTREMAARLVKQDGQDPESHIIGEGGSGLVFEIPGTKLAYKSSCDNREFNLTVDAGLTAAMPIGRVMELVDGYPVMSGMILRRGEEFDPGKVTDPKRRTELAREMADLLALLHEKRQIIHGDIKPPNFVLINGHLRLIDFGGARYVDEKLHPRDLQYTEDFISPNRIKQATTFNGQIRPAFAEPVDDIYAMGLTVMQMYVDPGSGPLLTYQRVYMAINGKLHRHTAVDIETLVPDARTRFFVKGCLRQGGLTIR
jgi:hypothetical protein